MSAAASYVECIKDHVGRLGQSLRGTYLMEDGVSSKRLVA